VLTHKQAKQLVQHSRDMCRELAHQSLHLADAFNIPDHLIQAPIALDWEKYNLTDNQGETRDYLRKDLGL